MTDCAYRATHTLRVITPNKTMTGSRNNLQGYNANLMGQRVSVLSNTPNVLANDGQ